MSIKAMTLVEERSRAKGSNLAVVRTLADHAKDDGKWAWPSPSTIAWKHRLTTRAAELIIRKLVKDGELLPEWDATERRLYLHIRCICEWVLYQAEGPIPLREKISRSPRPQFAERLIALAKSRVSSTEKSCASTEDSCASTEDLCADSAVSPEHDGTSQSQPSLTVSDPSIEDKQGAAPPTAPERDDEKPGPPAPAPYIDPDPFGTQNVGVITKLVHEMIDLMGDKVDDADLRDAMKWRLSSRAVDIRYSGAVLTKAIDSARWQRAHRREAHA